MTIKDRVYKGLVGTLGGLVLATGVNTQYPTKPQDLSDLVKSRSAYAEEFREARKLPHNYTEDAIDNLIRIHKTEVDGKVDIAKDYERIINLLKPVEQFKNYDFSKESYDKRKSLAEIFNDYAVALKLSKAKTGDNDYRTVIDLYKFAINLDQNLAEAKFNLAFLLYQKKLGNYKEALVLVNEFLKQKPNDNFGRILKERLESLI